MNRENRLAAALGIQFPVIQAPMYGVTTPEMVAAANTAGCLGSLPLGDLPVDVCRELIRKTKELTDRPFAVNLFVNDVPELTDSLKDAYSRMKQLIEDVAARHGLAVSLRDIDELRFSSWKEQAEVVLEEGISIVSFTFGNLDEPAIRRFKDKGCLLIGTCTSVREARILEESGIDMLCVQGLEAGGHRGSFLSGAIPQIGGLSLLSRIFDTAGVPLIYAGGLYDAKTIGAARALGAQGFQVGSLLLGSTESALKQFEKERLRMVREEEIVLTRSFTGRYARGIKNAFIDAVEQCDLILPYPYQNKLTAELRRAAKEAKNPDFVSLWTGQSVNGLSERSATEILRELIAQADL